MSSKVFVYNQPDFVDVEEKGILPLTIGLFFDGTRNKLGNTEIRKKVKNLDGYGNASDIEKDIYNSEAKGFWSGEEVGDDSFSNDFTNVARMKLCCTTEYAIYVEGPGTDKEYGEGDSTFGFAFGTGPTGIREKVKRGCGLIADKIFKKKRGRLDIKKIQLTIDAYGFSRGAAGARNFIYEIQKKAYEPIKVERKVTYKDEEGKEQTKIEIDLCDTYKDVIETEWLHEGKLPPLGDLGIALLKLNFPHEELKNIKIRPRFLGIYDTVSSYSKQISLSPDFTNDVEELKLNNLGRIEKTVHFTAQDEHRENFGLTRIRLPKTMKPKPSDKKFIIEKNFPGVHSDVGGSYNNGEEVVAQIENSWYLSGGKDALENLRLELISEHWFNPEQIEVKKAPFFDLSSWILEGTRELKKEYSYIPLHFMNYYANDCIKDFLDKDIEKEYSIDKDPFLEDVKNTLSEYVIDDNEELKFISDEEIVRKRELKKSLRKIEEQKNIPDIETENDTVLLDEPEESEEDINGGELAEVVIYSKQQALRKLRNEYLHWSANRIGTGFDPSPLRKREEYPK